MTLVWYSGLLRTCLIASRRVPQTGAEKVLVVTPRQTLGVEQIAQRGAVEARVRRPRFGAGRIDQLHQRSCGRVATAGMKRAETLQKRVLRNAQRRILCDRRRSAHDVLVRGERRTFVGLEHAIGERVLLGHREVRLHVAVLDVAERSARKSPLEVRHEPLVGVTVIAIRCQRELGQHRPRRGIRTAKAAKQVIRRAVFLNDDDDVPDRFCERRRRIDFRNRGTGIRRVAARLRARRRHCEKHR